jgi:hypothetical protein
VSRALDSRRVAEYRRRVSDPAYLARALTHVAGLLAEMLLPGSEHPRGRGLPREYDASGDPNLFN